MTQNYDIEKVRDFLGSLRQPQLVALCQERFSDLLETTVDLDTPKARMINELIQYAITFEEIDVILDWGKKRHKKLYDKHVPFSLKDNENKEEFTDWLNWVAEKNLSKPEIVEKVARLCELLQTKLDEMGTYPEFKADEVLIDVKGNLTLKDFEKSKANAQDTLQVIGSLLFQSLTGKELPSSRERREAELAQQNSLPISLTRLIIRLTDDPPKFPEVNQPNAWATLLRATQSGKLLSDQLSSKKTWPLEKVLRLVIDIGDEILDDRKAGAGYLPISSELIELHSDTEL